MAYGNMLLDSNFMLTVFNTFFQRGYSAHPQILDYEGRKHTAPHTYTAEAAYAVHFFQRGYSAHPQILNYEGRKHTTPHTYTGATAYTIHFLQ